MSYQTYITDALVCGAKESKTSDKSFLLFTREAGMLFASARSVREERSRQRFALQEFSLIRSSLIKGKSGWRIGSVQAKHNYYSDAVDKVARGSVVRIFRQLRRFVQGEEQSRELFDYLATALPHVEQSLPNRSMVDDLIQIQMMYLLGYVSKNNLTDILLNKNVQEISHSLTTEQAAMVQQLLGQATQASQL